MVLKYSKNAFYKQNILQNFPIIHFAKNYSFYLNLVKFVNGTNVKIIAKNKIAHFNYELIEKYEAGVVLEGWEVKSIRAGNINLKNSFASFKNNELFLSNAHISLYMAVKGEETKIRKLLLSRRQLNRLQLKQQQNGYTIVPTMIYWTSKSLIKIEIALAKGKNKADKRQSQKRRDDERAMKKILNSKMGV